MKPWLFGGVAVACLLATMRGIAAPNFVLMIADDMAWHDCGAYGNPGVGTPNLDRLAEEGMRFDRAFLTCSSCSPSRASLLTGRYPHATGAEQLHWPLPGEQVTFTERLRAAGYWVGAAGKWHLGNEVRDRFDEIREADESGFQLPSGAAGNLGVFQERMAGEERSGCTEWVPMLKNRPRDQPFFLWLAALDPHRPYESSYGEDSTRPEEVRVPAYLLDCQEVREELAKYQDEIRRLDRYVGLVLEELDRQGVREDTVVVFISDNGQPFPRAKTTLYDSGIRTPMLVRWPGGGVKGGSVCGELVSSVDFAATFLDLAGVEVGKTFQGRSFRELLKGRESSIRDYVFAEKHWHDYEDRARAVRSKQYKYIRNDYPDLPLTPPADAVRSPSYRAMLGALYRSELSEAQRVCFLAPRPREELYAVEEDSDELVNLAGREEFRNVLEEMREVLARWERETGDRVPEFRTSDEFDRLEGKPLPNRIRPRPSKKEMEGGWD